MVLLAILQSCKVAKSLLTEINTVYIARATVRYIVKAIRQTDSNKGVGECGQLHGCTHEREKGMVDR